MTYYELVKSLKAKGFETIKHAATWEVWSNGDRDFVLHLKDKYSRSEAAGILEA